MLSSRNLLVGTVLLGLVVLMASVAVKEWGGARQPIRPHTLVTEPTTIPAGEGSAELRIPLDRAAGVDSKEEPSQDPEIPQTRFGIVRGAVYGHSGVLMPDQAVLLVKGSDPLVDLVRRSFTDDLGSFTFSRVPPGRWTVMHAGERKARHSTARLHDEVDVIEGQVAHVHLALDGDRKISGAFTISDHPGLGLELILRRATDEKIVGRGWSVDPLDDSSDRSQRSGAGTDKEARPPGWFTFTGLGEERYVLRVIMGRDPEGNALFIERDLDLTTQDIDLGVESLTVEEFFAQAKRR
jgi:hypothetical protein